MGYITQKAESTNRIDQQGRYFNYGSIQSRLDMDTAVWPDSTPPPLPNALSKYLRPQRG
jgi:hypothetical protein